MNEEKKHHWLSREWVCEYESQVQNNDTGEYTTVTADIVLTFTDDKTKCTVKRGDAEDVEVFFPVGVAFAGVVGADGFAFEGVAGGLVEAGGEGAVWGAFAGGVVAVGRV